MLKKIRTILAAVFFILITLLFLDFTGTAHHWLSWMAKIQFLPAVMALNVVVVVALLVLTLVFGRIYCSVICPLGVFQDLLARFRRKKNKYSYSIRAGRSSWQYDHSYYTEPRAGRWSRVQQEQQRQTPPAQDNGAT